MQKKSPSLPSLDDVWQAIGSCQDRGAQAPDSFESLPSLESSLLRFHPEMEDPVRRSYMLTQFYLQQYGRPDAETLEVLLPDMFIAC